MKNELSRVVQHSGGAAKAVPSEESGDKPKDPGEDEEVRSKETVEQQNEQTTSNKEVKVEYIPLDLASFQSTKECVRIFKERDLPLHILVNNAALLGPPYSKAIMQFATSLSLCFICRPFNI